MVPTARPFGYGNANGAFLAACTVAAVAAVECLPGRWRLAAAAEIAVLFVALVQTASAAATALAVVAAIGVLAARTGGVRLAGVARGELSS